MKLDFTFDANLVQSFNASTSKEKNSSNVNSTLDSQQQTHPLTSPSTDQLSEKIASVKKVWDHVESMLIDDNQTNPSAGSSIEDAFFTGATDAQTAAIAGAAFSMSQAVLQSESQNVKSSYETSGGGMKNANDGVNVQTVTSVSSSKTEGPNVAKVRPQQMRVVESSSAFARQASYSKVEDAMGSGVPNVYIPPLSSPTAAMYSSPNNVVFPSFHPHQINGGKQSQTQQNVVDPFAASVRPFLYQQVNGQNPLVITTPQAQIDPAFGNAYRPTAQTSYGNTDYAFAVGVQPVRQTVGQSSMFTSKSSTNAGPFLLQDANAASLFSQPPPPLSVAPPQQTVLARNSQPTPHQQQSSNVYPYTQPNVAPPPLIQPFNNQSFGTAAKYGQSSAMGGGGNYAASKVSTIVGQAAAAYNNWNNPNNPSVTGKGFNPTIGPPNSQQKSGPPGAASLNAAALINLISASGNQPYSNPSTAVGTPNVGLPAMYVRNLNRSGSGGGGGAVVKQQHHVGGGNQQNVAGGDHSKRDGELLQHIDNFINSTSGDEEMSNSMTPTTSCDCGSSPVSNVVVQEENDC